MTPERWQQIRGLLEEVLELPAAQRSGLSAAKLFDDPSLRQEVETLLASSPDVRSSFLQSSLPRAHDSCAQELPAGTFTGPLQDRSLPGQSGMGVVMKAEDQKLAAWLPSSCCQSRRDMTGGAGTFLA